MTATWDGPPGQPCECPNLAGDCDGRHPGDQLPDDAIAAAVAAEAKFFDDDEDIKWPSDQMPEQLVRRILEAAAPAIAAQAADPVYHERDQLVAALSKLFPAHFAIHDGATDWDDEWRNVICIHLPTGQVTWHIHVSEVPLFGHLTISSQHWDGHDTAEKYRRLNDLPAAGGAQ